MFVVTVRAVRTDYKRFFADMQSHLLLQIYGSLPLDTETCTSLFTCEFQLKIRFIFLFKAYSWAGQCPGIISL